MTTPRINESLGNPNPSDQYKVIVKKEYPLSSLERSMRVLLATAASICTLGLACFSKSIRDCFAKNKKISHSVIYFSGGGQTNIEKFAARQFIQWLGMHSFGNVRISNPRIAIEFAKLVAQQNGREVSKYINNHEITKQADLIEIAKIAAQESGWGTSEYIKNYNIIEQAGLIEIAKIAAQESGWGTSEHIKNYGIIEQADLIEVAKIAVQQNGWGGSKEIKNYGIIEQAALVELAKLAAQQHGRGASEYIKNYGITDQQALIELAKLAAQQDGRGTSKYIKNYGITDRQALIGIAKVAAQQNGWGTSEYIEQYDITEKDRIEIAKFIAQQDGSGVSKYIESYRITEEKARVEIAKIAAQQDGERVSFFIESYAILDQKARIEIAELAAQESGVGTSEYIENYGITDQEGLIKIAKLAAQQDGEGVSEHIKKYRITEQALVEIAEFAAQQDGWGTSKYIKNYGITDQETLIRIAKLAAQQNGKGTSQCIKNYGITKQEALIEIAKLAAQQDGWRTSEYIESYGITNQEALIEIAKLAAQQDGWGTSKYIKNYAITKQEALVEIVSLAIKMSVLNSEVLDFWNYLPNYGLLEEELKKIQILYACHYGLNDIENQSMKKFVVEHAKSCQFPSFTIFDQKITKIEGQISTEQDSHKRKKLQREKQRASLCFSLILNKCHDFNIPLTEDQQKYFIKVLEHRNQKESCLLMQVLVQNFERSGYFSSYQELVDSKEHLILPMILINQWLIESPDPSDVYRRTLTQIEAFLRARPQRDSLRYAKGFLPNLLQVLIALSHSSSISLKQRFYLLSQCFQFALSAKGKEWEAYCKRALDTVNILASMNLLTTILEELGAKYSFEDVIAQFKIKLQTDIFVFSKPLEGFYGKYLNVEEALRIPLALVKYASNLLKIYRESNVFQELQRLVIHVLEGTVKQERYQTKNNPHLQKIQEDFPKIFQAWQTSQEAIEIKKEESNQQPMDFFAFLRQKILIDKHFPRASFALTQYLKERPYSIKNMQETDQQIVVLCRELCDQSVNFSKKLTILKELFLLVGQNEFKNDIDSLYTTLKTTYQQKSVLIVDSDDWQDLFLSGTEVLGSCQRIDGDPSYNVCLMAYVLDGKNRILCVKDPKTKKILARCIFRLLFREGQPVLFQERIYPNPCKYEDLLNKLAETRTQELGFELFTCNNIRDNFDNGIYSLESLGSCSPYEYVDASEGKTKGVFRIPTARKVRCL